MRVSIVGTGYVGLVTGACLAEKGCRVVCVDIDPDRVARVNRGESPVHEDGLPELLRRNVDVRLTATADWQSAIMDTDVTFIAVGTPLRGDEIDLTAVESASTTIGEALREKNSYHAVIVKSTVVPGTTDSVVRPMLERASGKKVGRDIGLGANPEFLTEGTAVEDFLHPDRIVLGGNDDRTLDLLENLYHDFEAPKLRANNRTAEMIKYASNALLATMISFANEIGNLCSATGGVDAVDVMRGVHLSRYLSAALPGGHRFVAPITSFLEAGCGFGGSCLPKDVGALVAYGRRANEPMRLLESVLQVNKLQHRQVLSLLDRHFRSLTGVRVAVLGLAFKPDTDDVRESPAIPVIRELLARGARVSLHDPVASGESRRLFGGDVQVCDELNDAVRHAEAVVLITRWKEYEQLPALLADLEREPVFVDGRRMIEKRKLAHYEGIGLGTLPAPSGQKASLR